MKRSFISLFYIHFNKPLADFFVATVVFLILSPLFLFLVIRLTIANAGKPFFFQQRPGKNGKIFKVVKFKTMNDKKDKDGNLLPDADRITPLGSFIRRS